MHIAYQCLSALNSSHFNENWNWHSEGKLKPHLIRQTNKPDGGRLDLGHFILYLEQKNPSISGWVFLFKET
jgi:hypothetical protein